MQGLGKKVRVVPASRAKSRFRGSKVVGQSQGWVLMQSGFLPMGVVVVLQIRPDEPVNIPSLVTVEEYHAPQRVCENDDAPENIFSISVTRDTSHL